MIGMGLSFGPLFGSFFYSFFGYDGAFYTFAVIMALLSMVSRLVIPENVNFPSK